METSFNRRQAVTALLAGLGVTAVGCAPDPAPDDSPAPSDGDAPRIDQNRFAAALGAVFTGTPFEDDANALPGQIQADIDRLTEKGMTSTAKLLERSASILMVPAFEVQATLLSTPDLNTDPQPLALAYAEGLAGFLENRDDMVALLKNAATEVTADMGADTVSPDTMAAAAATVLDHEQRNRKWMHESGQSGEAWANHILRGGQSLRAQAAVDQSLSSVVDDTVAATLEVGEFDDTMSVLFPGLQADSPPPPDMVDDICFAMTIFGILLAPFSLGASLADDGANVLLEVGMHAFGTQMTVADMTADGMAGQNPCETIYLAIQLAIQGIMFLVSVALLGVLFAGVAGSFLGGALMVANGLVLVSGAVCAFDKIINLLDDWNQTCA